MLSYTARILALLKIAAHAARLQLCISWDWSSRTSHLKRARYRSFTMAEFA